MIEGIARACRASQEELDRLYVLWASAIAPGGADPGHGPTIASSPGDPCVRTADPAPPADPPPPATPPERVTDRWSRGSAPRRAYTFSRHGVLLAGLAALVMVAAIIVQPFGEPRTSRLVTIRKQWISGPTWILPAQPVASTLFGVTINSSTGNMPDFDIGAVRLWDSGTLWARLAPRPGAYDWSILDRHVDHAAKAGLPVLFVVGGTPAWAAPEGARAAYPEDARTAPPDDLAEWDGFIQALIGRYRGRIEAYELWPLANDRRLYSGSTATMVEMTRRASRIIRAVDPAATIVCPGMGNLWTPEGRRFFRDFAARGGYNHCDVASVKLFQRASTDPPETMLELIATIDRVFHEVGAHPRIWNTGTTYSIPLQGSLGDAMARNYAVRFFLMGIFARNVNLERMYFYNWGGAKIPIVLQVDGGSPTGAARAVEQLGRWLRHAQVRSCGHGPAVDLPDNAWQCQFTIVEAGRDHPAAIEWTDSGTATTRAATDAQSVRRLDGTTERLHPGDVLTLSEEPLLITFAG